MSRSLEHSEAEPAVNAAAVVSLLLGGALLIDPTRVSGLLGVAADRRVLRAIGLLDVALAPGLYLGRPRWRWVLARAASNPVIAVAAIARARSVRARILAAGLVGATVMDVRLARRMRAANR